MAKCNQLTSLSFKGLTSTVTKLLGGHHLFLPSCINFWPTA